MASVGTAFSNYWRLLRHNRNFRRLWFAQIVSEIGDWFYVVAIYSLLLELTGKASSVAVALVLQVLPQTLVSPIAGVINDRISRKRVMIISDVVRAVIVTCMLLVRSSSTIWLVYPLLFVETVMWGFFEPARNSVLPNIVEKEDLTIANTLASTTWSFNFAVGSLMGGLVAAFLGRNAVFVINGLSFVLSAVLISSMGFREAHAEGSIPLRWRDLVDYGPVVEGMRYIRSDPRRLAMVLVKCGIGILATSWVLFPVMGEKLFPLTGHGLSASRAGMFSMSLLMGARGVGALVGPILAATWAAQNQHRLRKLILAGLIAGGVGYLLLGIAPNLWLACAAVIFAYMGGSNLWVSSTTLLQMNTEDRFRGRVFSADLGVAMLTMATTCYVSGQLMDAGVSARTIATGAGLAMAIPGIAWFWALNLWREPEKVPAD